VLNWNWYAWDLTNVNNTYQVPLSVNPPSETPAPGGIAYSNTVNWLLGAQMTSLTIDTNGTWVATLQRLGATNARVVWNPDATTNFSPPAIWPAFQMRDLSNHITSLSNLTTISVGVAPVILDSAPALAISNLDKTSLTLLWPASPPGFSPWLTINLASTNWLKLTNAPVSASGNWQLTLPRSNGVSFYRLSSQL